MLNQAVAHRSASVAVAKEGQKEAGGNSHGSAKDTYRKYRHRSRKAAFSRWRIQEPSNMSK